MLTEHDEQSLELTYPDETVHTIRLVLYDSDKENHTPDTRSPDHTTDIRPQEAAELEQPTETGIRRSSPGGVEDPTRPSLSNQINQDLPTDIESNRGTSPIETQRPLGTTRDVCKDSVNRQALRELPIGGIQTDSRRTEDRRPSEERNERTHYTGTSSDNERTVTNHKSYRSFEHLRTVDEVVDRITYLVRLTGNPITTPE